jgi:hypothetical protein
MCTKWIPDSKYERHVGEIILLSLESTAAVMRMDGHRPWPRWSSGERGSICFQCLGCDHHHHTPTSRQSVRDHRPE